MTKFQLGQKVFYVAYVQCGTDEDNEGFRNKSVEVYDYVVLYGTVMGVRVSGDTFEYRITVEEHEELENNNIALDYMNYNEEYSEQEVREGEVFSLGDLEAATKLAQTMSAENKKKQEQRLTDYINANHKENAFLLTEFLMREYTDFDIMYTNEELTALNKMISSPRCSLEMADLKADLEEGYDVAMNVPLNFGGQDIKDYYKNVCSHLGMDE